MPQTVSAAARLAWSRLLCAALRKLIDACAHAQGDGAAAEIERAIEELNDLPRRVLADHCSSSGRVRRILGRVARIEQGLPLLDEIGDNAADAAAPAAPRRRVTLGEEQRLAARITQHLQRGSISRAARALKDIPIADASDPAVLAKLAAKHPQAPPPDVLEDDEPALQINAETLGAVLRRWRGKRGTAPGLSGLTPEHIVAAAEVSDETCGAILEFINLMLSGKLPRHGALLDSALIGLMKPNDDVRPIAIGEVWYRLAASCALAAIGHAGADLAPLQLGAGVKGGVEAACHAVKAALESDPDIMALHMDVKNAFNALGRNAILAAVKRVRPELLPFVQWAYGAATNLVVLGSDAEPLKSACGVRQGDPLSCWLFAIAIQPVLEATAETGPSVAFVDDDTLLGNAAHLRSAFHLFKEGIASDGRNLQVADAKCALTGGDRDVAAALAEELGVQHKPDGMICYGTPVGQEEYVATALAERADGIVAEVERLMALPLAHQNKWCLLKSSLSVRLEHLKRTVPWDQLAECTRRVEAAIENAAAAIFALPDGDDAAAKTTRDAAIEQMTLPQRHGGFGLPRTTRDEADAAYLSGAAMAESALEDGAPECRPFSAEGGARAGLEERWQRLHGDLADKCGWRADEGLLTAEVIRDRLPRAGHDVARAIGDRRGEEMLAACDLDTPAGESKAAYLRSASGSAAAAFLNALPVVPTTRLENIVFETHGRIRLALGQATNARLPPCRCTIGDPTSADHPMVCNQTKGEAKMRHDLVTDPVCQGLRKSGAACVKEPRYGDLSRTALQAANAAGTRGDIMAVLKGQVIMTDTKIIHPAAASYRHAAARRTGAAAKKAEQDKWRTFRANGGGDSGAVFVPTVVESVGRLGQELQRFINKLGNNVGESGGCKRTFVRHMLESISCALARGNTRMYNVCLFQRLRGAGSGFELPYEAVVSGHCDA